MNKIAVAFLYNKHNAQFLEMSLASLRNAFDGVSDADIEVVCSTTVNISSDAIAPSNLNRKIRDLQAIGAQAVVFMEPGDIFVGETLGEIVDLLNENDVSAKWGQHAYYHFGEDEFYTVDIHNWKNDEESLSRVLHMDQYSVLTPSFILKLDAGKIPEARANHGAAWIYEWMTDILATQTAQRIEAPLFLKFRNPQYFAESTYRKKYKKDCIKAARAIKDLRNIPDYTAKIETSSGQVRFLVRDIGDQLQETLAAGSWFEPEELKAIKAHIGHDSVIVEIGANCGNHVLFYATEAQAKKIIPFEANLSAAELLIQNIGLNGLENKIDARHLGLALSNKDGYCELNFQNENTISAVSIKESSDGIPMKRLDDIIEDQEKIDFIKIDVDGHEIEVLEGAMNTIARYRPVIFVEVGNENKDRFMDFARSLGYQEIYSSNWVNHTNFMMGPA